MTLNLEESVRLRVVPVGTQHLDTLVLRGQRYSSPRWQGSAASTVPGPVSCTRPCYQMLEVSRDLLR